MYIFFYFYLRRKFAIRACCAAFIVYVQLTATCSSRTHTGCIVAMKIQQWLPKSFRMLLDTCIAYVVNLYRTVWKWLTRSTDRTCIDPLQVTALTHIICLQVNNSLKYPAIYSYNSLLINDFSLPKHLKFNPHLDIFSGV